MLINVTHAEVRRCFWHGGQCALVLCTHSMRLYGSHMLGLRHQYDVHIHHQPDAYVTNSEFIQVLIILCLHADVVL